MRTREFPHLDGEQEGDDEIERQHAESSREYDKVSEKGEEGGDEAREGHIRNSVAETHHKVLHRPMSEGSVIERGVCGLEDGGGIDLERDARLCDDSNPSRGNRPLGTRQIFDEVGCYVVSVRPPSHVCDDEENGSTRAVVDGQRLSDEV